MHSFAFITVHLKVVSKRAVLIKYAISGSTLVHQKRIAVVRRQPKNIMSMQVCPNQHLQDLDRQL
jgi:hypothetical protein